MFASNGDHNNLNCHSLGRKASKRNECLKTSLPPCKSTGMDKVVPVNGLSEQPTKVGSVEFLLECRSEREQEEEIRRWGRRTSSGHNKLL